MTKESISISSRPLRTDAPSPKHGARACHDVLGNVGLDDQFYFVDAEQFPSQAHGRELSAGNSMRLSKCPGPKDKTLLIEMVCQHNRALLRHSGAAQPIVNVQTITPKPRLMNKADQAETFPQDRTFAQEIMTMSNARKYTAIAALGVGLALAAATPASAQWYGWSGPYYGYGACCGYGDAAYHPYYGYGYAPPHYYVFYHRPYYAYGYRPYSGDYGYHHRRYGYGYGRAHHRPYLGDGYGAYRRY